MKSALLQAFRYFIAPTLSVFVHAIPALAQMASTRSPAVDADQFLQRQEFARRLQQDIPTFTPTYTAVESAESIRSGHIPDEKPCVPIQHIQIDHALPEDDWTSVLSGPTGQDNPVGRCLGSVGVSILLTRLQDAILRMGYLTTEVMAPDQNLTSGTLHLQVREGRVARILNRNPDIPLSTNAWTFRSGDLFNLRSLEQTADNLTRLQGLGSRLQILPGEEIGTSDIELTQRGTTAVRFSLGLHDGGNRSTGQLMRTAALTWDNPLGLADKLHVSECASVAWRDAGPRDNHCFGLSYSIPVGWWLFSGNLSRSRFYQTVFGAFQDYRYSGRSELTEFNGQRVIARDGHSVTSLLLGLRLRSSANAIDDQDIAVQRRRTTLWEAALQRVMQWPGNTLTARVNLRHSSGAFGAVPPPESVSGEVGTDVQVVTAQLAYGRGFEWLGRPWSHASDWLGQWNQTRLTPQDRFCTGFRGTLRGLDGQQVICGQRGWQLRNELSTPLPDGLITTDDIAIQAYVAVDLARVSETGFASEVHLGSFAVGLRGFSGQTTDRRLTWDFFIGVPLSIPDHFQTASASSGFSLRIDF